MRRRRSNARIRRHAVLALAFVWALVVGAMVSQSALARTGSSPAPDARANPPADAAQRSLLISARDPR